MSIICFDQDLTTRDKIYKVDLFDSSAGDLNIKTSDHKSSLILTPLREVLAHVMVVFPLMPR